MINIKKLLLNPKNIYKSIIFSIKASKIKFYEIKVISSSKSILKKKKTSEIYIEKRLNMGLVSTRVGEIAQIKYDRCILRLEDYGKLYIKGNFQMYGGSRIIVGPGAKLELGNNSFISLDTKIICKEYIKIGENCAISWDCMIMDTDFHNIIHEGCKNKETKPINIGNNVWIGSKVSILKGVTIGDNVVVAANSVVTKSIPSDCIVAGNPAKVTKNNIKWQL